MKVFVPLTKSPKPHKGRIGSEELQDWYRGLMLASTLTKSSPDSTIFVVSNVHIKHAPHEADLYQETLLKLGVNREQITVLKRAKETIGQIQITKEIYGTGTDVTYIVAPSHYMRTLWLTRDTKSKVVIGWGLPRPKELVTDIVLSFIFPLIDFCGKREWFQKLVIQRREKGEQF